MGKLDGRIAIVTGSAQGIGYGCAKVLASHGALVILVDVQDKVKESAEEIAKVTGGKTDWRKLDLTNLDAVKECVDGIIAQYGKIDILHNNAGFNVHHLFQDVEVAERDKIFGVNVFGVWNMTKAVYPYMLEREYGRIIITSSVTGVKVVDPTQTTYAMTKGAVSAFTRALAVEAAAHGITVNAVLPGWVRTPKVEAVAAEGGRDPEATMREMAATIPIKRLCNIDEIGDLVAFLASDESKYITGTEMVIDGGSTLPETYDFVG